MRASSHRLDDVLNVLQDNVDEQYLVVIVQCVLGEGFIAVVRVLRPYFLPRGVHPRGVVVAMSPMTVVGTSLRWRLWVDELLKRLRRFGGLSLCATLGLRSL